VRVDSSVISNKLNLKITIAPGWHINSHQVLNEFLIPTSLKFNSEGCVKQSAIEYPKDKKVTLGFQKEALMVYEGNINIIATIEQNQQLGCRVLTSELKLQTCSDEVCLAPETLQLKTVF